MVTCVGQRSGPALVVGLTAMLVPVTLAPPASAAEPGPAFVSREVARDGSLTCYGTLDEARRPPVLLVPGTAATPEENWGPTYLPVLLDRGHAVCTVAFPDHATRDAQVSSEYVVSAIRAMAAHSTRRVSIVGHSQGALLAHLALRMWPDLSPHVDDVIGLAGVYDRGSWELIDRCLTACTPVLHQLATGSRLLADVRRRALPTGPAFTNIGARGDTTVTPQPWANHQSGAHAVQVQDLCPGRIVAPPAHAMIVGDAAALAIALDALDHPGTADLSRIDPAVCADLAYPEFDEVAFLAVAAHTAARVGDPTATEPRLGCRHRATCDAPSLRGRLLTTPRLDIRRHRVVVRARVLGPGRLAIRLGPRRVVERVRAGRVVIRIHRPNRRAQLIVKTRPRYYTAWGAERTRWIRGAG